mmetsp:Transcript_9145/g.21949  ORF Transcript_9145/g.21949 Transcript_9145/m.21949 type:complete len:213 (+) Transcript_9145:264-902(+)
MLNPRCESRRGVCGQAGEDAGGIQGDPGHRHARVLREAPDHHRLEGADQRPQPLRGVPDQHRPAHRPQAPVGHQQEGAALRGGVPGRDLPPVRRGPGGLGGHRGEDHGVPGAPGAGVRSVHAHRVQERHHGRYGHRPGRHPVGVAAPPVPGGDQAGAGGDRADHGECGLPCGVAGGLRDRPELLRQAHRRRQGAAGESQADPASGGGLLARQ